MSWKNTSDNIRHVADERSVITLECKGSIKSMQNQAKSKRTMPETRPKTVAERSNRFFCRTPFVDTDMPLVGCSNLEIRPSVCRFAPSVPFSDQRGFTLIELMVALVVAAILTTVAVPSMRTFIQNERITTETNSLIADLSFARSEALKSNVNVTVCKSANPTVVPPACSTTGSDWSTGRVIFIDSNNNGTIDTGETILRVREALPDSGAGTTLYGSTSGATSLANFLTFTPTGVTTLIPVSPLPQFTLCDKRGSAFGRGVVVTATGSYIVTSNLTSCNP